MNIDIFSTTALPAHAIDAMHTQLDPHLNFTGMRIARIQVRNFGTYDGPATTFDFGCAGAVMAGGNGMGKSTAFDAMKVAFVMNPELNNAAGTKGERSVTSYYVGAYGDEESENGEATEASLRQLGNPEKTMGILVQFQNAFGRIFTAVRLLYIDQRGARTWRYITGNRALSLDEDFPRIETEKIMRDRGNGNGWGICRTYKEFMKEVAEGLGMESAEQAIRAFRLQSIATGLPQMASTTDFARDFILPPDDFLVDVAKAVESIAEHRKIRDTIIRATKQVAALTEICDIFANLEEQFAKRAQTLRAQMQFDVVRTYSMLMQDRQRRKFNRAALMAAQKESARIEAEIVTAEARIKELTSKIEAAEGNKIDALERERDRTQTVANDRLQMQDSILDAASKTNFGREFPKSAEGWQALDAAIPRKGKELDRREEDLKALLVKAITEEGEAKKSVADIEKEISYKESSRSALDKRLKDARDAIARATQVSPDTLPVLAELLQVQDEYLSEWELAANRLLGGWAKKILVPENIYAAAKAALPSLEDKTIVRLVRVSENDVCDEADARTKGEMDKLSRDILAKRMNVKDKHPMAPYARSELLERADYTCVTNAEFGSTKLEKAICPRGANSSSDSRAEIDNRDTKMVLGWSVDRQIAALKAEWDVANARLVTAQEHRRQCDDTSAQLRNERRALMLTEDRMKPWEDVDASQLLDAVDRLNKDIDDLQTPEMEQMRTEKRAVELELSDLRKASKAATAKLGEKTGQVASDDRNISERVKLLGDLRAGGKGAMTRADYARIRARLIKHAIETGGMAGNGYNLFDRIFPIGGRDILGTFETMKSSTSNEVVGINKKISSLGVSVDSKIDLYFKAYGNERDLPARVREDDSSGLTAREEWRDRKRKVQEQDLPKAESAAAEFRKLALHQQVLTLRNKLLTYDEQSRAVSDGINKIMAGNVFNPATGSFARLKVRPSGNPYHRELVQKLEYALDRYTELSDDEVFDRITDLADYLADDDTGENGLRQRTRRKEIARLANRFDAMVEEYRIQEDGSEKLVRQITGSGTLSGGEKDRLSNFLLAAAMKCAFGGHDDAEADNALCTILIDEAFGRSTDENASAQIAVLDSFGLQIIAATPMSKIRPFQAKVGSVFIISRPTGLQTAIAHLGVNEIDLSAYEQEDEVPDFSFTEKVY